MAMGALESLYCVLAAFDEVRQDHGTRGDVGLVDRSIREAVEEREPAIERDAATNREDR